MIIAIVIAGSVGFLAGQVTGTRRYRARLTRALHGPDRKS